MLSTDALKPRSDNPDEAAYLNYLRQALVEKGIWLRIEPKLVRDPDPDNYGHWIYDGKSFRVWLSFGPNGDPIPLEAPRITREKLLKNPLIATGYYEQVIQGPTLRKFHQQVNLLESQIRIGFSEHARLEQRKDQAPIVGGISDFVGGATLPNISIWDGPHKAVVKALTLSNQGNLKLASANLANAAMLTRNAAQLIADYAKASASGAASVVTFLKVVVVVGEIAEFAMMIGDALKVGRIVKEVATGEEALEIAKTQVARGGRESMELRPRTQPTELRPRPEPTELRPRTEVAKHPPTPSGRGEIADVPKGEMVKYQPGHIQKYHPPARGRGEIVEVHGRGEIAEVPKGEMVKYQPGHIKPYVDPLVNAKMKLLHDELAKEIVARMQKNGGIPVSWEEGRRIYVAIQQRLGIHYH